MHRAKPATRRTSLALGSSSRSSSSLGRGSSSVTEKSAAHTPRQCTWALDEKDSDIAPRPLYPAGPGGRRCFLEELSAGSASDQITGNFTRLFSRCQDRPLVGKISSQSSVDSTGEDIEESFSKRDIPVNVPDAQWKRDPGKELLTDVIHVYISETDTISLLDIPPSVASLNAAGAEATTARNKRHAGACSSRTPEYKHRSTQTLNGAVKNKHVQVDAAATADAAVNASAWDMYDTLHGPQQDDPAHSRGSEKLDCPDAGVDLDRGSERSSSSGSTAGAANAAGSLKDGSDLQPFMRSDTFPFCLLVMERSIFRNIFQPSLAAYRQLPARPGTTAPRRGAPSLQRLWVFGCRLSRGRRVSSLVWNKKNPDLLAVGYGDSDTGVLRPGLVCCWSLKNPTWPEGVIHCDSAVTSLDFSASSPRQLAVGMHDGSVAVYSVSRGKTLRVISSSGGPKKHSGPVWQLRWTQQKVSLTAEEKGEALFSVSGDGRISSWLVHRGGFDCVELMKLKTSQNTKRKADKERVLSALTPGLCFDVHPTDSSVYLAGTWEGHIHKCSCSNSHQFLETFRKHFSPVNRVAWCPHSPDVFLSCSSDWTIQLWRQDRPKPVLGLSSQRAMCDIRWSPKWATVFGAVSERQLQIWDLNKSILDPVAVQPPAAGVTMEALLFAPHSECVLVGDSDGQVTVYQLKNFSVGQGSQVDVLEKLVLSAAST